MELNNKKNHYYFIVWYASMYWDTHYILLLRYLVTCCSVSYLIHADDC